MSEALETLHPQQVAVTTASMQLFKSVIAHQACIIGTPSTNKKAIYIGSKENQFLEMLPGDKILYPSNNCYALWGRAINTGDVINCLCMTRTP